ncbi:hypothetical protein SAMN05216378_3212 [Paenibacillus catalpae]|uniref:Uncharacterized protein n=1 Tax=Paenibacillus catalpae TaxID=1045775 RepID=A0A1I2AS16_9BACL|nr:hypothetical protein [Paenibacillus catalpae]SFE46527.1 hypothetical protein SAMN05216378_3212 [Paenibacillus catalpae]
MTDGHFKLAELADRTEALEEIRQLEQKLTDQIGSTISLIAYESEEDK